jgi:hypothetical protein
MYRKSLLIIVAMFFLSVAMLTHQAFSAQIADDVTTIKDVK